MGKNNLKNTHNNKNEDGKFKKKNIKHGHEESARSTFGAPGKKNIDDLFDAD